MQETRPTSNRRPREGSSSPATEELELLTRRELASRARGGSFIYALVVPLCAMTSGLAGTHAHLFGVSFVAFLALGLCRFYLCRSVKQTRAWDRAFLSSCGATGMLWGLLVAWLTLREGMELQTSILFLVSSGLCAGATSAFAPRRSLLWLVQATMMAPIVGAMFSLGTRDGFSFGVIFALYAGYLVSQGIVYHNAFLQGATTSIRLMHRSEQLEMARAEAERANRVKGDFLANVSHEIRTPINGVIGMTEEVLMTPLGASQRSDLEVVRDSATSLLSIVNQILDFSRFEAGHPLSLTVETFELDQAIAGAIRMFAGDAARKGLDLDYEIDPELGPLVQGDQARFRQVLTNLVGNALKFTNSGSVLVKAKKLDQEIEFQVIDTGEGISEEALTIIFEPFSQVDTSLTRKYQGTGLGLSIVRQLVETMGGNVSASSRPGQGSVFVFRCSELRPLATITHPPLKGYQVVVADPRPDRRQRISSLLSRWGAQVQSLERPPETWSGTLMVPTACLEQWEPSRLHGAAFLSLGPWHGELPSGAQILACPLSPSSVAACLGQAVREPESLASSDPAEQTPMEILLAEDQSINAELASRILQRWGHRVTVVSNGQDAVETFADRAFDLILMDIQMPVVDGLQATRMIRATEKGQAVPILAVTAHVLEGELEKCLQCGMNGYLTKPLNRDELRKALLDRQRASLSDGVGADRLSGDRSGPI